MDNAGLHLANYCFYIFHTALIIFNLIGWLPLRTRKFHLITILATFTSWTVLGFWRGWGYCFLTDWHYSVLSKLGEKGLPNSYIAFLIEKLSGWLPGEELVNSLTLGLALIALICSLWVNYKSIAR